MHKSMVVVAAMAAVTAVPAAARTSCAAMAVKLTAASRAADARLVTRSGQRVTAANVSYVLSEPGWRLIWATPADAERGVFFFRQAGKGYRLVDTWGGVIAPDERAGTIDWARTRKGGGPSPRLSACFTDALLSGK